MEKQQKENSHYDDCKTKPKLSQHSNSDVPTIALYLSPQIIYLHIYLHREYMVLL